MTPRLEPDPDKVFQPSCCDGAPRQVHEVPVCYACEPPERMKWNELLKVYVCPTCGKSQPLGD